MASGEVPSDDTPSQFVAINKINMSCHLMYLDENETVGVDQERNVLTVRPCQEGGGLRGEYKWVRLLFPYPSTN